MTDTAVAPIADPTGSEPRPVRLAVDGLTKSYGKRAAVKGVSFAEASLDFYRRRTSFASSEGSAIEQTVVNSDEFYKNG